MKGTERTPHTAFVRTDTHPTHTVWRARVCVCTREYECLHLERHWWKKGAPQWEPKIESTKPNEKIIVKCANIIRNENENWNSGHIYRIAQISQLNICGSDGGTPHSISYGSFYSRPEIFSYLEIWLWNTWATSMRTVRFGNISEGKEKLTSHFSRIILYGCSHMCCECRAFTTWFHMPSEAQNMENEWEREREKNWTNEMIAQISSQDVIRIGFIWY